ncbi:MAG: dephospho-CoA kinase [Bacteroidetes bacterium]|nr:dephospho-CoA kinase [Bacteroidota bacterium]
MLKVGITGGIGSGKTTVCKIFSTLGIPIYYADERAKELMVTNPTIIQSLKEIFGEDVYFENGKLNRPYLASKVFQDKQLLQQLNAVVHPAVFDDTAKWYQQHQDKPYTIYETAIMFESGSYKLLDKIITVFAPIEERISRIIKRDNISREEVLARIDKQLPEEIKIEKADFVIHNDLSEPLIIQVLEIHNKLLILSE